MSHATAVLALACACLFAVTAGRAAQAAWPTRVPGFVPPEPGEHPRLFFRRSDVPALRERMRTAEGRRMVAHLRDLLGHGGEELPRFEKIIPLNLSGDRTRKGHFTIGHPAGYGMLYQLTGQTKYADLARTCLERMFDDTLYEVSLLEVKNHPAVQGQWNEKGVQRNLQQLGYADKSDEELARTKLTFGQGDMDPRFNWTRPGTGMRAGPLLANVAMAYDLCYEAWDPAFRLRVAGEIFQYDKPEVFYQKYTRARNMTLARAVEGEGYPPTSNHYGFVLGGAGIALLAVRGDPGIDTARADALLGRLQEGLRTVLTEGFGDKAYFAEGFGPGHVAANPTLVPFLGAARVAWGRDFVSPDTPAGSAARWLTLKWVMGMVPDENGTPLYTHVGGAGSYTAGKLGHRGYTDGGEFGQGFASLVDERRRAALLWTWNRGLGKSEPDKFGVWHYPSKMVPTMAHWPMDLGALNPREVLPRAVMDTQHGYFIFRSDWQGPDDCVFCLLLDPHGRHGYVRSPKSGAMGLYGLGIRFQFRVGAERPEVTGFEPFDDGGGVLSFRIGEKPHSVAVDYGGRTGAAGVIVVAPAWTNPKDTVDDRAKWTGREPAWAYKGRERVGDARLSRLWVDDFLGGSAVMVFSRGDPPTIQADGNTLKVGEQSYTWDGARLHIGGRGDGAGDGGPK